jgi:PadR family transcriptional regulator PadR
MLARLAERGLLETAWEQEAPLGRPPRHLYRLSTAGAELARSLPPELVSRPGDGWAAAGAGQA